MAGDKMVQTMPRIFILYSGPQVKSVEALSSALVKYAFEVESGTSLDNATPFDAVIAVSTVNAWATAKFRESARSGYAGNKLMLVRFNRLAASKPHPYTQIIENSLVNWKSDDDTDWCALLKRLGLLSGRSGLEQLARIWANEDSQQHVKLQEWANAHNTDPLAERVRAHLSAPSFVPTPEQRRSLARVLLILTLVGSVCGFGYQTYRIQKLGYNDAAKNAWARVDTRDIDSMRDFLNTFKASDQADLAAFLIKEKESAFWAQTQTLNTIESYETYLSRFSDAQNPAAQFIENALEKKQTLVTERQEVFSRLQISLRAMGLLTEVQPIDNATAELVGAIESYRSEDTLMPPIEDWDIIALADIETLAARIKVFGRRQMLGYKSNRWADLDTESLQQYPTSLGNLAVSKGFQGTNSATIFFEEGSYIIPSNSMLLLRELAQSGSYVDIIITGHDDGSRPRLASFRLGEKRAANVKNALQAFGLNARLMSAKSWGATRPAVDIDPANPAQLNRRVEVTFLAR